MYKMWRYLFSFETFLFFLRLLMLQLAKNTILTYINRKICMSAIYFSLFLPCWCSFHFHPELFWISSSVFIFFNFLFSLFLCRKTSYRKSWWRRSQTEPSLQSQWVVAPLHVLAVNESEMKQACWDRHRSAAFFFLFKFIKCHRFASFTHLFSFFTLNIFFCFYSF